MATIAPTNTALPATTIIKPAISPRDLSVPARDIAATPPTETPDQAAAPTAKATQQAAETNPPPAPSTDQPQPSTYTALANANASTIRGTNLNIQA